MLRLDFTTNSLSAYVQKINNETNVKKIRKQENKKTLSHHSNETDSLESSRCTSNYTKFVYGGGKHTFVVTGNEF